MPPDDERDGGAPVIVLSDRGWTRLFGADPAAVGRTVLINKRKYEVVGIMPPDFRGLRTAAPDYWAPLALAAEFRPNDSSSEDDRAVEIVGRLKPGVSPQAAAAALTAWVSGNAAIKAIGDDPKTIALLSRQGTVSADVS
jgi:hypothetical protein